MVQQSIRLPGSSSKPIRVGSHDQKTATKGVGIVIQEVSLGSAGEYSMAEQIRREEAELDNYKKIEGEGYSGDLRPKEKQRPIS